MISPTQSLAETKDEAKIKQSTRLNATSQKQRINTLMSDGDKEALLLMLNKLTELLIQDLSAEMTARRSPIAIKGIAVQAPLSSSLADWLDARVLSTLHQAGHQSVVCIPCKAQVTSLTNDAWHLKQGLSDPTDIQQAAQASGAQTLLDLVVGWDALTNRVHLRARLYHADGSELWQQDYQNDGDGKPQRVTQAGWVKGTSSSHYQALASMYMFKDTDRVLSVTAGGGVAPSVYGGSKVGVIDLGVGWGERFGDTLGYRYALTLNLSANTKGQTFMTQLGGEWMARLSALPVLDQGDLDTQGLWLGAGASLNYVFIRQGVGLFLNGDWISSVGLGVRVKLGYQLAFGDLEPDLSGYYGILSILFLM